MVNAVVHLGHLDVAKLDVIVLVALLHEAVAVTRRQETTVAWRTPAARAYQHRHSDRGEQLTTCMLLVQPILKGLGRTYDVRTAFGPLDCVDLEQAGLLDQKLNALDADRDALGVGLLDSNTFIREELLDGRLALPTVTFGRLGFHEALETNLVHLFERIELGVLNDGVGHLKGNRLEQGASDAAIDDDTRRQVGDLDRVS